MNKLNNKKTNGLMEAIALLKSPREAKLFLRDLLTESEIAEFANRWKAAQMLEADIPYTQITAATGLSSTTIARISKWLTRGMGGYKLMIARTSSHHIPSSFKKGLG